MRLQRFAYLCATVSALILTPTLINRTGLITAATLSTPQTAPPGSYKQSCNRINVKGKRLSAYCRATDGTESLSALNNFDMCTGDIWNNNGSLTCEKPPMPALKVRDILYFLGGQHGPITKSSRAIKRYSTATISASEGSNCGTEGCTFYFAFYVDRKSAKGPMSPVAGIAKIDEGPNVGVSNNVIFKHGDYTEAQILPVTLKAGKHKLKVAVDPSNEFAEDNETDNYYTVTIVVQP